MMNPRAIVRQASACAELQLRCDVAREEYGGAKAPRKLKLAPQWFFAHRSMTHRLLAHRLLGQRSIEESQ